MNHRILNFKNLVSLKIPVDAEETRLLQIQTGFENRDWEKSITILEDRIYNRIRHLEDIFKNLPVGATIVDIGAGNSLVDLELMALFPEKDFKFILVDSDEFINSETYKSEVPWNPEHYNVNGYNPYNDWSFVKKAIALNGFPLDNFTFVHPNDFKECSTDVIMSFASYGWHYPLETYLDLITAGLKQNGYLSFMPLINAEGAVDKLNDRFGPAIAFKSFDFDENTFNCNEAQKVMTQIEAGKLSKSPFAFNAIWKRST